MKALDVIRELLDIVEHYGNLNVVVRGDADYKFDHPRIEKIWVAEYQTCRGNRAVTLYTSDGYSKDTEVISIV